jgi:hypothetical protein
MTALPAYAGYAQCKPSCQSMARRFFYAPQLLKKSPSFVLAGHCRLTISAAFTNVTRLIRRVVNLRPSTYPRGYASALRSLRPCWIAFLSSRGWK